MLVHDTLRRSARLFLALAVTASLSACGPGDKPKGFGRGADRGFDVFLGADSSEGGALGLDYDFSAAVAAPLSVSANGSNLFVAVDPGFNPITADEPGFFAVADGTEVTIVVTAVDPGVSMKLNGSLLAAAGDAAVLGVVPDTHVHPEWQVMLAEDAALEQRTITFKATAPPPYTDSPEYTLILAPTFEAEEE